MTDPDLGGGASRSTDPAAGSSAATDVSLREFFAVVVGALDRHLTSEILALRRETEKANENSDKAIKVAADEAAERLKAHNGLIEQMQQQAAHFAPREIVEENKKAYLERFERLESFQAKLIGGLGVLLAIGVANLVKVWTG